MDHLHERAAALLGWEPRDVTSFSLASLRELVRAAPGGAKLAHDMTLHLQSGTVVRGRARGGHR